jgi:alpha-L-rhamnosidase
MEPVTRRAVLAGAAASAAVTNQLSASETTAPPGLTIVGPSDARWIWMPGERTLPSTFVLFRREIELGEKPVRAPVRIAADSRYLLTVNGQRVQWGPAPCDPRWLDVDTADIAAFLKAGPNVIGVEVLFYGVGDGTWPAGKPGLLFRAEFEMPANGERVPPLVSDASWLAFIDRAHPPGHYKRWFLRALQEQFDARLHPYGWDRPGFQPDSRWMPAALLRCASDKPPASGSGPYSGDTIDRADPLRCRLQIREIPPVRESIEPDARLAESGRVEWLRDPEDWFESRVPGSFRIARQQAARPVDGGAIELPDNAWAIFELPVQMVGFPRFTIDAAEGTVVEMMPQESHDPARTAWLDTHHFSWSRFICREGRNEFENFDYESLRWLQLSVRNARRPVRISGVGVRRRQFPWPHEPVIQTSDAALQRLFDAAINTLRNSVIETAVDGMGRERQQYSGDGGHQLHAVRYVFGETRAPRRYLRTFSQGQMTDGYFADSWPAYDRLARVSQKEMGGAFWGPLLDHGVGFNFDCWNHYLETGDKDALVEPWPRLKRFAAYLESIIGRDGLLPVEDLGLPTVWMDHQAYKLPRHKKCSFNLYTAGMLRHALAQMARVMGESEAGARYEQTAVRLHGASIAAFWDRQAGLFVDNLPWRGEEGGGSRLSDRTLAQGILFEQCPGGSVRGSADALAGCPPEMGISYPCNAGWRYQALAKAGRVGPILDDFRRRWATMRSVRENLSIQEDWTAPPDSGAQWSHCAMAPLFITYMDLAGIRPLDPGFARCRIRPQLGDLPDLRLTAQTPRGPIEFEAVRAAGGHTVRVHLPAGCEAVMVVPGQADRAVPAGGTVETLVRST